MVSYAAEKNSISEVGQMIEKVYSLTKKVGTVLLSGGQWAIATARLFTSTKAVESQLAINIPLQVVRGLAGGIVGSIYGVGVGLFGEETIATKRLSALNDFLTVRSHMQANPGLRTRVRRSSFLADSCDISVKDVSAMAKGGFLDGLRLYKQVLLPCKKILQAQLVEYDPESPTNTSQEAKGVESDASTISTFGSDDGFSWESTTDSPDATKSTQSLLVSFGQYNNDPFLCQEDGQNFAVRQIKSPQLDKLKVV